MAPTDVDNAHPDSRMLQAFLNGRLPDVERLKVESHVLQCELCGDVLRNLTQSDRLSSLAKYCLGAGKTLLQTKSSKVRQAEPDAPKLIQDHPRYEVFELVGRGGMGAVYRARHKVMDREVAIKVIDQKLVGREEAKEQFLVEVKAAAKLSHPNIVTAYDAESRGELLFLAMELVEGEVLTETVKRCGPLESGVAIDMIRQAAQGLSHAHAQGLVHRDIKPSNLLLCENEQHGKIVKILDFGLASFHSTELRVSPSNSNVDEPNQEEVVSLTGTLNYISPEQFEHSEKVDQRTDIFSLGCTFHYLLTGESPFEDNRPLLDRVANPETQRWQQKKVDGLDPELQQILDRMLAFSPDDRFSSTQELLGEIDRVRKVDEQPKGALLAKSLKLIIAFLLLAAIFYPIISNGLGQPLDATQGSLSGRTALFVLPSTDIWISDYQPVRDVLDRQGVACTVTSSVNLPTTLNDAEERGQMKVDRLISTCDAAQYDIIVVCGGHWHDDLSQRKVIEKLMQLLDQQCVEREPIAAICGGQVPLGELGFLEEVRAADPQQPWVDEGWKANWVSQAPVVFDQNILTASDPDHANAFAAEICNLLEQSENE